MFIFCDHQVCDILNFTDIVAIKEQNFRPELRIMGLIQGQQSQKICQSRQLVKILFYGETVPKAHSSDS